MNCPDKSRQRNDGVASAAVCSNRIRPMLIDKSATKLRWLRQYFFQCRVVPTNLISLVNSTHTLIVYVYDSRSRHKLSG